MTNKSNTVSTKAGEYPVERKPGNWKQTAGALQNVSDGIKDALRMLEEEANG